MHRGKDGFAQVIVPSPLKAPLTYEVPPDIRDRLNIGMRVVVPLGKRRVTGVVVDFVSQTELERVKKILEILDEQPVMDTRLIRLIEWTAKYYLSSVGEVLAAILPAHLRRESRRIIVALAGEFPRCGSLQQKVLGALRTSKTSPSVRALARRFSDNGFYHAVDGLVKMGAVEIR